MNDAHDLAWVATRRKALLTQAEKDRLAAYRRLYAASGSSIPRGYDPHVVAVINDLLAP